MQCLDWVKFGSEKLATLAHCRSCCLNEAYRLSKWQAEKHFQGQTGLDGRIAEPLLPTALAVWRRGPRYLRIKPD